MGKELTIEEKLAAAEALIIEQGKQIEEANALISEQAKQIEEANALISEQAKQIEEADATDIEALKQELYGKDRIIDWYKDKYPDTNTPTVVTGTYTAKNGKEYRATGSSVKFNKKVVDLQETFKAAAQKDDAAIAVLEALIEDRCGLLKVVEE